MNLSKSKTICLALLGLLSFVACYDDKGNYNYIELDEVTIDTTGCNIQEAYSIDRYDTLYIAPNILYNGQNANDNGNAPLDYTWTIYSNMTGVGVDYSVDTLSTSRVLNEPITRSAQSYTVQLTVRNRETGVERYFQVACQVEESITAGWMILYERSDQPGTSDVGLVVNPLVKKNIIKNKEFWNLYSASNGGKPLDGKPVRIQHTVAALPNDMVIIATENDLVGANNGSFDNNYQFNDFFYDAPANKRITFYGPGGVGMLGETVINDNKIYYTSFSGRRNKCLGVAKSGDYQQLAPWASEVRSYMFDAVVYDQTAQRFLYVPRNNVNIMNFVAQDTNTAAFDVNNTGMELLMGDWGRQYYDYLLMKKGNDFYLAIANFITASVTNTNVGIGLYNITNSPNIANTTSMASSYLGEFVLYGAGNSVYNLKYNQSTTAETLWTATDSNEEVTCVRLQKYYYQALFLRMLPNANAVLHVATYNKSTGEGKLYQFTINPASGAILDTPRIYNVPGKVKDMGWKYILE